jgi:hypothetical protein
MLIGFAVLTVGIIFFVKGKKADARRKEMPTEKVLATEDLAAAEQAVIKIAMEKGNMRAAEIHLEAVNTYATAVTTEDYVYDQELDNQIRRGKIIKTRSVAVNKELALLQKEKKIFVERYSIFKKPWWEAVKVVIILLIITLFFIVFKAKGIII